jgi:hypothetical protein
MENAGDGSSLALPGPAFFLPLIFLTLQSALSHGGFFFPAMTAGFGHERLEYAMQHLASPHCAEPPFNPKKPWNATDQFPPPKSPAT